MCGIFACFVKTGTLPANLQQQFSKIQHRGPDCTSFVSNKNYFMGFHRLAIVGRSEVSDGYLSTGTIHLVCNGEIYNYQHLIEKYNLAMTTDSDCEVILRLWEKDSKLFPGVLQELDGVFAFVLYDAEQDQIFAARDRIGVRPLFYRDDARLFEKSDFFWFASEGKAIDDRYAIPFPPGHYFSADLLNSQVGEWANDYVPVRANYQTAQEIVKTLLTEAVRKRLMADRPIGFLLSGGLDSSLVASIASRLSNRKIVTFSIGLPDSPDLLAAQKVADFLQSDHHKIVISESDIVDALPKVIEAIESYDVTTIRASIPMYLISKYIRENTDIKVIFSGEGADELFGGYLYFHNAPSPAEFQAETHRLLNELYMYDVLRSDRTTSVWGLELRVPFLDADLLNFVAGLDPTVKMAGGKMEKRILREAFQGYLPDEILWRQKDAFSDAVGKGSVATLKRLAEENDPGEKRVYLDLAEPWTAESRYYFSIFQKYYGNHLGLYTKKYWMPRWCQNVADPSATVLPMHSGNQL